MAQADKQTMLGYVVILLLFLNTMFLGGIFFMIQAQCGMGFCPMSGQKGMSFCPFSKDGKTPMSNDMKGSMQ
jgi:hypothetical protein